MGLVTSIDWINWTKYWDIPVTKPSKSGWDNGGVESGSVVMIGGSLQMLYDDANFVTSNWQIGFAKSFFKPVSLEQETIMPTEFTLKQNYRITFKPSTQIS